MSTQESLIMKYDSILSLLSAALFSHSISPKLSPSDWEAVYSESLAHGVSSIVLEGAGELRSQIPSELMARWKQSAIGSVMMNMRLMGEQGKVLRLFADAGIPCAVLKGSSHSAFYPSPDLRPLGDIDLLVERENVQKASELLIAKGFRESEGDHPFHVSFHRRGTTVELHFEVSSFPDNAGGKKAREIMSSALDSVRTLRMGEHEFPVLSPSYFLLNALVHMERHMTSTSIGLRQLCDWAVCISAVSAEEYTEHVLPVLQSCGLEQFARVLTKTCVRYLGMPAERVPWCCDADDALTEGMMEEILRAGNLNNRPEEDGELFLVDHMGSSGLFRDIFPYIGRTVKKYFPVTAKYPVLFPFFLLCFPFYYLGSVVFGKRKKKSVFKSYKAAKKRSRLYQRLRLYNV